MAGIDNDLAENALAVKAAPAGKKAADTLTNLSIINMVEANLTDDFIINLINKSQVNFQVNVDAMIELSAHNVSSAVISAMKTAMRKKTSGEGAKNASQGG
jgi:precorrin-3B methylase